MLQLGREVTAKLTAAAVEAGTLLRYIFMNTAGGAQKVLQSIGDDNVAFMKNVAKTYDPARVFQTQYDGWLPRDIDSDSYRLLGR